jgi:hypothetical protein
MTERKHPFIYNPTDLDSFYSNGNKVFEFYMEIPEDYTSTYWFFNMKKKVQENSDCQEIYDKVNEYASGILQEYFLAENKKVEIVSINNKHVTIKKGETVDGVVSKLSSYSYVFCVDIEEISKSPSFTFVDTKTPVNPSVNYALMFPSHLNVKFCENIDDLDKIFIVGNIYLKESE